MSESTDLNESRRWRFGAEAANNIVQTIAIVAAGAWAVYTFIYQAKIAPAQEPPSMSVTCTLAEVGHKGGQVAIRSSVTRNNVGHGSVRLLAVTYNLIGTRVHFTDKLWPDPEPPVVLNGSDVVTVSRYYSEPEQEVIVRHGVLFSGSGTVGQPPGERNSVLNPGEVISRDMIFYADREKFDSVRFVVRMSYAKESDDPLPMRFELNERQHLEAVPVAACLSEDDDCTPVVTTDFTTDLSLW